jgi:hypothetical protein
MFETPITPQMQQYNMDKKHGQFVQSLLQKTKQAGKQK